MYRIVRVRGSELDGAITKLTQKISDTDPTSGDYTKLLSSLEVLTKLRDKRARRRVSPDTWVVVGGAVLQVMLVLGFERGHVFATQAKNHFIRTKI